MSAAQTYPLPPTSADRSAGQRRSSLNSFAVASYVKSPFFYQPRPLHQSSVAGFHTNANLTREQNETYAVGIAFGPC